MLFRSYRIDVAICSVKHLVSLVVLTPDVDVSAESVFPETWRADIGGWLRAWWWCYRWSLTVV